MVVEHEELTMLASANMEVFPDYQLRLRRGQGCAGTAWERAVAASTYNFWRPVQATQTQLTKALLRRRWKLTEEQISRTAHILWILSIPLFFRVGSRREFAGVLNFDGVHEPLRSPHRLMQPDFIGQCVTLGDNLVDVAAAAGLLPR